MQHGERKLTIARYRWHPAPPSRRLKLAWFATLGTILVVQIATWCGILRYSSWWILGVLLVIQGVIFWR